MSDKPQIVHCVLGEALSSVFTAQVLARIPMLNPQFQQRVLALTPVGQLLRSRHRSRMRSLSHRAKTEFGTSITHIPMAPSRLARFSSPLRAFRRWLKRQDRRELTLHCRNAKMADIALLASGSHPGVRVIYDCRGVECDEFASNHGLEGISQEAWPAQTRRNYHRLVAAEQNACLNSDVVLCVSHGMAAHLAEKYKLPRERFVVIPCCVDVDRFSKNADEHNPIKQSLNLKDKFVVTYLGSLAWYQLPEESLRIFQIISRVLPNAHFMALTTQPAIMEKAIRSAGIGESCTTVLSVSPQDVPKYLAASDLGLLLRHESIVNAVASPVKFGEYMAAGVPLIMTHGIGDYSQAVMQQGLGAVISLQSAENVIEESFNQFLTGDLSTARCRCRNFASEFLSWDSYKDTTAAIYRSIHSFSHADIACVK